MEKFVLFGKELNERVNPEDNTCDTYLGNERDYQSLGKSLPP